MAKYYTTSEVAKICNVHRNTIIGAIRKGLLKIHRTPGGHARISQEDLEDFCHRRSLPSNMSAVQNQRILLVEDDPHLAAVLAAGLKRAGYEVERAANGFDAGFQVVNFKPDVVLLDLMLPDINGDQVCRRIRETPSTQDLKVIGMSAASDQSRIDRMIEAGVDDFLPKPFEIETLLARITKLVGPIITPLSEVKTRVISRQPAQIE